MSEHGVFVVAALLFVVGYLVYAWGGGVDNAYAIAEILEVKPSSAPVPDSGIEGMVTVRLRVIDGPRAGLECLSQVIDDPKNVYSMKPETGDRVVVYVDEEEGRTTVGVDEYYKTPSLVLLVGLVVLVIVLVGGWRGFLAVLALLVTLVLIFGVLSRLLLAGTSPPILALVFSLIITTVTLSLIGGWTRKTLVATVGTVGGVAAAALLGYTATQAMKLSGLTGQSGYFLQTLTHRLDFRGLLLCGVIIGALGAVMDVCISIASALSEVKEASPLSTPRELFRSGLKIGRDVIGTMTNTLVLAYTGSSLTLILLLTAQRADFPLSRVLNLEFITVEILRSVVGLFGMALAIPLTAYVGAQVYGARRRA